VDKRVLNLGSGRKPLAGAVNLDIESSTSPDVTHDLNQRPWPFADASFDEVLAFDVIEHLTDIVGTMEEIHRVCRSGGLLRITTPHFSCANSFIDPTHRFHFSWFSFHYFTGENEFAFYSRARFRRRASKLFFNRGIINRLVFHLANRWPEAYERRWAWVFPAWFLYFELEAVKE
jgi:SAM-dependent methyltransferase